MPTFKLNGEKKPIVIKNFKADTVFFPRAMPSLYMGHKGESTCPPPPPKNLIQQRRWQKGAKPLYCGSSGITGDPSNAKPA